MNDSSAQNAVKRSRLYWVDALRGFAALSVMFSHYVWTPLAEQEGIWHYLISPGEVGVATFFCISGFLIPIAVRNISGLGVIGFVITRIFRLYPLYWICLLVSFLITPIALKQLLVNGTMLQRFVGVQDAVLVFWTLQVELVFYVIIGVIILSGLRSRYHAFFLASIISLCGVAISALTRHLIGIKAPIGLCAGLTVMFTVATYFENIATFRTDMRLFRSYALVVVLVLPASWLVAYDRDWGFGEVPGLSALTMFISYGLAVIIFFTSSRNTKSIPRWLLYVGEISYPLYLFHEPLQQLFINTVADYIGFWNTNIVSVAATFMLAAAVHRWVELPMIGVGKRLSSRWRQRPRRLSQALESQA